MKIEEVIKIYEFLENLSLLGFLATYILLMIAIYALLLPFKDKITGGATDNNIFRKTFFIICVLITASLLLLYCDAQDKAELNREANFVKQDLANSIYKQKSFSSIIFSGLDISEKTKASLLTRIIKRFPDQFIGVKLANGENGIAVIDPDAVSFIDKKISEKALVTSKLIASYMAATGTDTIYTAAGRELQKIDNEGWLVGEDFLKVLVGKNDLLPIYGPKWNIAGFTLLKKKATADKTVEQ